MLPVITIARQYGSGGHVIGEGVAKALGVPYYDKELIVLAAKRGGYSEESFEYVDERATNSLLYSMVMGNYVYGSKGLEPAELPINDKLYIIQSEIIRRAAQEGPCVVVGRCGDDILREHKPLLRCFIYGEKADRIRRLVSLGTVEEKKAADFITKQDKRRGNYYHFYTGNRWDEMGNYDLSIQSSTVGIDGAISLLVHAATQMDR